MKRLFSYTLIIAMLSTTATVFAKTINLHSEPKTDSKIIGNANTEAGITIVFTPKNGEWIKVANSTTGDVGWVKSSDLGSNGYNMRIITSGDGTHSYSVYQFGASHADQQQLQKEIKQLEQQQYRMRMHMAHMLNDMFYFPQPIFVPIVMMPEQQKAPPEKSTPTNQAVKQTQNNKS